ncbi:MAG TPA: hypothetical protein P5572_10530 [Phycisphaerae bacterium]|nr:hypothetical protein [Phycisphaerales bacterium]HRX85443.1 hypothetical protein [Phycisphaerae bacterium]
MDTQHKISALIDLAQRLDIEVREANLGGDGGGLCQMKGRRILFMDREADVRTRYTRALRDLAQLSEIDSVGLVPELRDDLNAAR